MKKLLLTLLCAMGAIAPLAHASGDWKDDIAAAKVTAAAQKKPILLDFTGSDWCGWCMKLDKEVFDKKEFKDYAKANLILVTVDFPHNVKQSKKLIEQNEALGKQYKVEGYPSIILIDAEGKVLGQTGYEEGGAAKYVESLKALLEKAKK
jgi:protein disulfide-isomerase